MNKGKKCKKENKLICITKNKIWELCILNKCKIKDLFHKLLVNKSNSKFLMSKFKSKKCNSNLSNSNYNSNMINNSKNNSKICNLNGIIRVIIDKIIKT